MDENKWDILNFVIGRFKLLRITFRRINENQKKWTSIYMKHDVAVIAEIVVKLRYV